MKPYKDIPPLLSALCDKLLAAIRINPKDTDLAGWGQFLDAEQHGAQIGTYGTSAALLLLQIANRPVSDPRICNLIEYFLDNPDSTPKLFSQNVRLAFLLLGLSRQENDRLRQQRQRLIQLLQQR